MTIQTRYRMLERLGEGGMGAVYRAEDRLTGRHVALKQVQFPAAQLQFNSRANTQNYQLALAQEFSLLATLRHPHIISVYDYGFIDGQPFYTMDLLESPQTIVAYGRKQPIERRIQMLVETLQALAYLHRRGVIHRDLKPENVLVGHDGQVKVLDFGLAMARESVAGTANAGTLAYMAPELFQGGIASEASDLYAVGLMAYELFSGKFPFETESISQLLTEILTLTPDISALPVSDDLKITLERLLMRMPDLRMNDALEVISAFTSAMGQTIPAETASIRESYLQAARFVGREVELATLLNALEAISQPNQNGEKQPAVQGSSWLIGGESGVGKSRLLEELRIRAMVNGALVLRGQAISEGGLPYHLWREPLRRLVLAVELTDEEAYVLKLELIPDLDTLLGYSVPDLALDNNDLRTRQRRLMQTLLSAFRKLATQPTVLILEDLQWTSESLDLLKPLSAAASELPLLIVGSYRDDESPHLLNELATMQLMPLKRLKEDEIAQLSASMIGEAANQSEVLSLLQHESEGNAFFLIEVVRALAEETGRLSRIGLQTLPGQLFVGGVQTVLRRRIGRVPEWAHPLLKRAAIAGRMIDREILTILGGPAISVDNFLAHCAEAGVLEVYEDTWRFSHDKLRETLLADLTDEERPVLYREVAEALETKALTAGEDPDTYASILAPLWAAAGNREKEGYYSAIAGGQARDVTDHINAQRWLTRALELEAHHVIAAKRGSDPRRIKADLICDLGEEEGGLGQWMQSAKRYDEALAIYQELGIHDRVAYVKSGMGDLLRKQGNYDEAKRLIEEALAQQRALGDQPGMALSLLNLGATHGVVNAIDSALEVFQEAHSIALELGDKRLVSMALNNIGTTHDRMGHYDVAMEYYQQSARLKQEIGDYHSLGQTLHNMGALSFDIKAYENSLAYYEQAIAIFREIGAMEHVGDTLIGIGMVYSAWKQDYAAAERNYQNGLDLALRVGSPRAIGFGLKAYSDIMAHIDDYDGAERYVLQALQYVYKHQLKGRIGNALEVLAQLYVELQQTERALELMALARTCFPDREAWLEGNQRRIAEIAARLPSAQAQAALERGAALDLDTTVQALLKAKNLTA